MVGLAAKQSRIRNISSTVVKVKQILGRRYDVKYFLRCGNQNNVFVSSRQTGTRDTTECVMLVILGSTPVGLLRNSILANRS